MDIDVRFRLQAAAKVLERAAGKSSDPELRRQLLKIAESLRRAAEGNIESLKEVEAAGARARTVEDVVRELREWIWKGPSPRDYYPERMTPMEYDFFSKILKPLDDFEKTLENIEKKLLEVLPF